MTEQQSGVGALPNVIVIGAAKCGTTSLHHYLDLHPEIAMAPEKELHFFRGGDAWARGLEWYKAQFDATVPVRGEASVSYTAFPRVGGVPDRMHAVVPEARLVYIVRDPVARIVSAYAHRLSEGTERRPLPEAAAELEGNDLVERSRYHYQLTQYLEHYPVSHIHVLSLESLSARPIEVMRDLYRFLDVDPTFESDRFGDVRNPTAIKRRKGPLARVLGRVAETGPARMFAPETRRRIGAWVYRPLTRPLGRPTLDASTRARLEAYLRPDAEALRSLVGQPFPEWSV